jgi:hypothetical protein
VVVVCPEHTGINGNLITTRLHRLIVVAEKQFPERRQPSKPHPDLKMFVHAQIGHRILGRIAASGVFESPVRWWDALIVGVGGLAVLLGFAGPGDTFVGHVVRYWVSASRGCDEDGLVVRVCAHPVVSCQSAFGIVAKKSPLKTLLAMRPQG